MSVIVQLVVGKLELVEADHLLHPLGALGGGVGVHVDAGRRVGVRLPRHHPARGVEGVPIPLVITGHEVHDEHVVLHGIEAVEPHLEGGEHPAAGLCHDHLRAQLVELPPQRLHLQLHLRRAQFRVRRQILLGRIVFVQTSCSAINQYAIQLIN